MIATLSNPWAISPESARYLAGYIIEYNIRRIAEFGAGSSSRLFAATMATAGEGMLTSFEENPDWCRDSWATLTEYPTIRAELIPVRTVLSLDKAGFYFAYRPAIQVPPIDPQMVFIDAPQGPLGRSGGVHLLICSVSPGTIIVFDDTARSRDQRTVSRLMLQYPELKLIAHASSVGRGLTMLQLASRVDRSPRIVPSAICGNLIDLLRSRREIRKIRSLQGGDMNRAN